MISIRRNLFGEPELVLEIDDVRVRATLLSWFWTSSAVAFQVPRANDQLLATARFAWFHVALWRRLEVQKDSTHSLFHVLAHDWRDGRER